MIKISKTIILFTILALIPVINLIVMHYTIGFYAEVSFDTTSYVDNISSIIFDILILDCTFLFLFKGNIKLSLLLSNITMSMWSFSNIIYSRFFFQYISISSIGQAGNLFNISMLKCIIEGFQWNDLFFISSILLSIILYYHITIKYIGIKEIVLTFLIGILVVVSLIVSSTSLFSLYNTETRSLAYIRHHLYTHHLDLYRNSANPNWTYFQRGSFQTLFQPLIYSLFTSKDLNQEQINIIKKEINNQSRKITIHHKVDVKNVIFIIVESYLSAVSDLIVDNQEITPNLNALKRDSTIYYNGKVKSNITIGESGDGQFICMTGLLPLRSEITVGRAKNVILPGLPKVLSQKMNLHTRMLIPTTPSMWEQEKMCVQYGISKLYSSKDVNSGRKDLDDQEIFNYLIVLDKKEPRPFFSLVLTMSMHQPYTEQIDPSFNIKEPNISINFSNYLNACHYTDKQIGRYLQSLKDLGLYNESLIIITADHHPNPNSLQIKNLSSDIPLYIINGNINGHVWTDKCNQLDIYTTILDLLIKDPLEWRGLGHSLLLPQYKESVSTSTWDISEWILQGNYFKNHSDI